MYSQHSERHFSNRNNWLRASVLGANDGLISTASLLTGVAAAAPDFQTLLLTGVSALIGGAVSMAAGEYVSVSSQSDTEKADLHKERYELEANPDILASVATLPKPPFCIGFAAESEKVLEYARAKRLRKGIPMLIANDVSQAMGKSTNQITIITDEEELSFPEKEKLQVAEEIVQSLARHLDKPNL